MKAANIKKSSSNPNGTTTPGAYKKAVKLVDQALGLIGVGAGLPTNKRMKVLRDRRALIRVKNELEARA
jgi:hypothetical protein